MDEQKTVRQVEPLALLMTLVDKLNCDMSTVPVLQEKGVLALGTFRPWPESPEHFVRIERVSEDGSHIFLRFGVSATNKNMLSAYSWPMLCVIDAKRYGSGPVLYRYAVECLPWSELSSRQFIYGMDENYCRLLAVILGKWAEVAKEFKLSELPRL